MYGGPNITEAGNWIIIGLSAPNYRRERLNIAIALIFLKPVLRSGNSTILSELSCLIAASRLQYNTPTSKLGTRFTASPRCPIFTPPQSFCMTVCVKKNYICANKKWNIL